MSTNIAPAHRAAFEVLISGRYDNFALFSCFLNGEPAVAIVAVNRDGNDYTITRLFVSVTEGHDPDRSRRTRGRRQMGICRFASRDGPAQIEPWFFHRPALVFALAPPKWEVRFGRQCG